MGTGPEVRSEGQGVEGHSQLDSTQEEARVRKEGGKVWCSFSASPFSSLGFCSGARRPKSGPRWTLTLNRGGEMKTRGVKRSEKGRWAHRGGAPQHAGFGRLSALGLKPTGA